MRLSDRERRGGAGRRGARPESFDGRWRCSYHAHVIHPRIDDLLDNVDSRYALVIVAAKRARQINNYHQQLGEGTFEDFPPPLVESRSKNYLTMAMEEIAEGKIKYSYQVAREPVRQLRASGAWRHNAARGRVLQLALPAGSPPTRRAS